MNIEGGAERLVSRIQDLSDEQQLSALLCQDLGILSLSRFEGELQRLEGTVTDPERVQAIQNLRRILQKQIGALKLMTDAVFGKLSERQEQSKKMIDLALNGRSPEFN